MENTGTDSSYFSAFGGLWIDRKDFSAVLDDKMSAGELTGQEAQDLRFFEEHGYIIFPQAVDVAICDDYAKFFDKIWAKPPPTLWVNEGGKVKSHDASQKDRIVKIGDLHYYYKNAAQIVYPERVLRFLNLLYEKAPTVFQSMTVRKGTQESLHTDTGPLSLTEPMSLLASWVALEDVVPGSGELQYLPRSHRVPEKLVNGKTKAHNGDMAGYHHVLEAMKQECADRNYQVETFIAKKGDVLMWAADLLHGGMPIKDPEQTRKSMICHFMPHGVKPTFYDASKVDYLDYGMNAWYLNRFNPEEVAEYNGLGFSFKRLVKRLKNGVRKILPR